MSEDEAWSLDPFEGLTTQVAPPFGDWPHWTDDALIAGGMVLVLLVNLLARREIRRRRRLRIRLAMDDLIQSVCDRLRDIDVQSVEAFWNPGRDFFVVEAVFPCGKVVLTCRMHAHPQTIADAARHALPPLSEESGSADGTDEETMDATPPSPQEVSPTWWQILGVPEGASLHDVKSAYRTKAMANHPDLGGSEEQMALINAAMDEARRVSA